MTHERALEPEHGHYLAPIDGLRAIAIIAVVGFHIGLPGFGGGYAGVDVFFVISGFLIINQIRRDLERGRFSVMTFYARRVLRILPTYLLVIVLVTLVSYFVLSTPDTAREFSSTAIFSPLMVSNFTFYLRSGYFDIEAFQKPLLNTWTLAVEEQFYLIVPFVLLAMFRLGDGRFGRKAFGLSLVLLLLSLTASIANSSSSGKNVAFYLAPWRAWEFVAGGLIGAQMFAASARMPRVVAEIASILSLAAIISAITLFNAQMPYPSYRAVLPVAGTVLAILTCCAQPRILAARLLGHPWITAIGLLSYGWYLWHWPILSFLRISRLGEPALAADVIGGGLVAFVLACLSYRYIELPIRRWRVTHGLPRPERVFWAGVAACIAVAIVGGGVSTASFFAARAFVNTAYGVEGRGTIENGCITAFKKTLPANCFEGKAGLLLGDSHAEALAGSFTRYFDEQGVRLVSLVKGGCDPLRFAPTERKRLPHHNCDFLTAPLERLLATPENVTFAIIESAWIARAMPLETLTDLLRQFDAAGIRTLLIGQVPALNRNGLDCVIMSDRFAISRDRCNRDRTSIETERVATNEILKLAAAQFSNVRYLDPIEPFCDKLTCRPYAADRVYYRDATHLLPSGADVLLQDFDPDFRWLLHKQ